MNHFTQYSEELNLENEPPTISNWIDHDAVGASHALGEEAFYAISEVLGDE